MHRSPARIRFAVLAGALAIGTAWPAAAANAPLTPAGAVQMALAHDFSVRLAEISYQSAQLSYQRAQASNLLSGTDASRLQAESDRHAAQLTYAQSRDNAVSDTIDALYALRSAQANQKIAADQLKLAQMKLDIVISKEKTGAAQALDEVSARASLANAQSGLTKANASLAQALDALRTSLGLDAGAPVDFGDLPAITAYTPPTDGVDRAVQASPAIVQATTALKLAQLNLDQVKASGAAPLDVQQAQNGLDSAQVKLDQAKANLAQQVKNAIAQLNQADDALQAAKASLELAQQQHDIIVKQAAAGLKTDTDVLSDSISLAQSQNGLLNAQRSYQSAVYAVQTLLGEDLTGGSSNADSQSASK
ncbi:MAG TPA: TolC family protein [Limnochordia bacterium]|nr:TolC family protein [Limnochordia bacterium]